MSVRVRHQSSVNVLSQRSRVVKHQGSAASRLGTKVHLLSVTAASRTAGKAHAKMSSAQIHAAGMQRIVTAERIAMIHVVAIQTIAPAAAIRVAMSLAVATAVTSLEAPAAVIVKMAMAKTGRMQVPASAATPQAFTVKGSKRERAAQAGVADRRRH